MEQRNHSRPIELGQSDLQLSQCEVLDLVLVVLSNDRPSLHVGVGLTAGS